MKVSKYEGNKILRLQNMEATKHRGNQTKKTINSWKYRRHESVFIDIKILLWNRKENKPNWRKKK